MIRLWFRWLECFLLLIGFAFLSWYGFSQGQAWLYQDYQEYKLEQALRGRNIGPADYIKGKLGIQETREQEPAEEKRADGPKVKIPQPRKGGLIGRIEIPRLKLSAIVREGVDDGTLSRAVGHLPETALPGEQGNFAIAAHRDTFFRGLRNVRKGDRIKVTTPDGVFEYDVDALKIIWPRNVDVLKSTADPTITLITCYPFNYVGSAPKRFIVQARQVGTQSAALPRTAATGGM
jgi:sortase A